VTTPTPPPANRWSALLTTHLSDSRRYLLSGVSYAIPFVACGGILIAAAIAFAPMTAAGPDFSNAPFLKLVHDIGTVAFSLLVPVLAGYIAFGIADRPGLVAGFVGGAIANQVGAGFLGGIAAGLLAGFVVYWIKRLPVPRTLRPVMPILVIPVVSSLIVGILMFAVIGAPIKDAMTGMSAWLAVMSTGNRIVLAVVLGAMIAFDMGGPVNKVAFFFGAAMIKEGNVAIMGACAAAICIPPLGLGLATLLGRASWSQEERDAGWAALAMGMIGITEGAIPFAAADPVRVIPTIMAGSAVGSVIAMLAGVGDHAPHGGPIVLPVVDNRIAYVVAIVAGCLTVAFVITALRRVAAAPARREA
jgi:fructose-specific phosphotransferase system IIC component